MREGGEGGQGAGGEAGKQLTSAAVISTLLLDLGRWPPTHREAWSGGQTHEQCNCDNCAALYGPRTATSQSVLALHLLAGFVPIRQGATAAGAMGLMVPHASAAASCTVLVSVYLHIRRSGYREEHKRSISPHLCHHSGGGGGAAWPFPLASTARSTAVRRNWGRPVAAAAAALPPSPRSAR